jgi:cation diffusion facilitator family transporter
MADHEHDHDHEHHPDPEPAGAAGHDQADEKHAGHSDHDEGHGHTHGVIDPALLANARGVWALKVSLVALLITAVLQAAVVAYSGSVGLLAETLHNFGDAFTAVPLWIAFSLATRPPTRRFTYGLGRAEDLAGLTIVLIILLSALGAGYAAIDRLLHPATVSHLGAVMAAAIIGFIGNEAVAVFRLKVGKEIGSAALVADGYHARSDGLTSLAVLAGAVGVSLGFPLADPLVGLLINLLILKIVWDSAREVFSRMLDGVDPAIVDEIHHAAGETPGVREVTQVRVRWLGHRLVAEVHAAVAGDLSVAGGHALAEQLEHTLLHHLPYLSGATIHIDPAEASGPEYHHIAEHTHDELPRHSH